MGAATALLIALALLVVADALVHEPPRPSNPSHLLLRTKQIDTEREPSLNLEVRLLICISSAPIVARSFIH